MLLVPDASVVLKWFLRPESEPYSDQALALRQAFADDQVALEAPQLMLYEIGNILGRRLPEAMPQALLALLRVGIVFQTHSEALLRQTWALMRRFDVTFYDASYHALALLRHGVFVTADQRYLDRAGAAGAIRHLRHWDRNA